MTKAEYTQSMKKPAVCAAALLLLSLAPILLLGRYNVMCIDDYDYGRVVHDTWLAAGSVRQTLVAAWRHNIEVYHNWQGTYVSCMLMQLCPMNFDYGCAWIVPVVMLGMSGVSSYLLGKHILCRWMGFEKTGAAFVLCVVLFLFYQVMEAPFEGIYWYNGATHYMLMESLWFFALTFVLAGLLSRETARTVLCCAAGSVLAVLVGGGNLVTGLQMEILLALLLVRTAIADRRRIAAALLPLAAGSASFLVNVLAPGNAQRDMVDMGEGYSAVSSIALSFYHAGVFAIRWTPALVIVIWLMLVPVLWKLAAASDRQFEHPVWVTAGAVCVVSAMFTPTLYAVGMTGLSRVDNIIQLVYYLCLFGVTAYWMGYLSHRAAKEPDSAAAVFGSLVGRTGRTATAVCFALALFIWLFTADKNTYTGISALRSLVNGEGRVFYTEAMQRHALYEDDTEADVVVAPYSARPALFGDADLSEDADNWMNLAVAQYYHKASVRVADGK